MLMLALPLVVENGSLMRRWGRGFREAPVFVRSKRCLHRLRGFSSAFSLVLQFFNATPLSYGYSIEAVILLPGT